VHSHSSTSQLQPKPTSTKPPRVAIVYDKLAAQFGGAEHVLQALHQAFPAAPLFTSVWDSSKTTWLKDWEVRTSFLQSIPGAARWYKLCTPLMPLAIESLDLSEYEIVISVASEHAKGVLTSPKQLHLCYLLTPTRYLYSHAETYQQTEFLMRLPGARLLAEPLLRYLRRFDQVSAFRPDAIIPISERVAARSREFYQRETAPPLYPPIPLPTAEEVARTALQLPHKFALSASRLVAYKRIDLAIAAALQLRTTLAISGTGPTESSLRRLAADAGCSRKNGESLEAVFARAAATNKQIVFLGYTTERELSQLFSSAQAFLLPGVEDFGIAPLQAAAHGTPSVLHAQSGAAELLPEPLSRQIKELTPTAVAAALQTLLKNPPSATRLHSSAAAHSTERFTTQFTKVVYDLFIQKTHAQNI
jgi:glycosyltransferase involved in cell wall biosynthesis